MRLKIDILKHQADESNPHRVATGYFDEKLKFQKCIYTIIIHKLSICDKRTRQTT